MCSISGIISANPQLQRQQLESTLETLNSALVHRGPDDQGLHIEAFENGLVGLANTRLAIIDLSRGGHQPMHDSEAGITLTYNGEVYNFRELRAELGDVFGPWRSNTDTEVVLRAYRRWGTDAFAKLRGMFAIGIWDAGKGELILARDQFGIKPLYYSAIRNHQSAIGTSLIFASEVRALLATGLISPRLSREGLASYLEYGSIQAPASIIDGIQSLLPGHYLSVRRDDLDLRISDREFQNLTNVNGNGGEPQPATAACGLSREQAVAQLREMLTESVRLQLVSDVPLGIFLSGGMDSSALVALMSRATGEKPKTFSVVFDEAEFSETAHSRMVAQHFQSDHHEIPLREDQLLEMLLPALAAMDQPTMDGANTFVVAKAVKEAGVTVALSGLGGDELFAGYSTFRRALRLGEMSGVARGLLRSAARFDRSSLNGSVRRRKFWQLAQSDGSSAAVYEVTRQLFSTDQIAGLSSLPAAPGPSAAVRSQPRSVAKFDSVNEISVLEMKGYMSNTLLRDTDSMSMAHSLEVRVPFVDSEIVSYVLGLPGERKLDGNRPKPLLADAVADLLPQTFLKRPKMGFMLPLEKWMQGGLGDEISKVFREDDRLTRIGLDAAFVAGVWQRFRKSPRSVGWSRPWSLYVLAEWCELHGVTN